jgi:hypothetical protein
MHVQPTHKAEGIKNVVPSVFVVDRRCTKQKERVEMDLIYLGLILVLAALSWGLIRLCEKL